MDTRVYSKEEPVNRYLRVSFLNAAFENVPTYACVTFQSLFREIEESSRSSRESSKRDEEKFYFSLVDSLFFLKKRVTELSALALKINVRRRLKILKIRYRSRDPDRRNADSFVRRSEAESGRIIAVCTDLLTPEGSPDPPPSSIQTDSRENRWPSIIAKFSYYV